MEFGILIMTYINLRVSELMEKKSQVAFEVYGVLSFLHWALPSALPAF